MKTTIISTLFLLFSAVSFAQPQSPRGRNIERFRPNRNTWRWASRQTDTKYLASDEAKRVAELVMLYQRNSGGWPKNTDFVRRLSEDERKQIIADKKNTFDTTTDNGATTTEMDFLARMYNVNGNKEYKQAVQKGIQYLLSGQYKNGGWPQFWPAMEGYQVHITYNDNAMVNTMRLLEKIRDRVEPYNNDIASKSMQKKVAKAFDKGVECILKTQIVSQGELTVWCQQHDHITFAPAKARSYELPSFCSSESANILLLLMDIKNPNSEVKRAIHAGVKWLDTYKLTGLKMKYAFDGTKMSRVELVKDSTANQPLWARYYDLERREPFVCDRDGIPRKHLSEIGEERRNGYGWYQNGAIAIYEKYDEWADKYDAANKVKIDVNGKGANELGIISLD